MPSLLIALCFSFVSAHAFISEGFIREKNQAITLEDSLDPRIAAPTMKPCSPDTLKKFKNVYVQLEWEKDSKKNCYVVKKVVPKVYDPLKNSRVTK